MSRQQRFGLVAVAVAVAVAAFVVARPGDDDDEPAPAATQATAPAETQPRAEAQPAPEPEPVVHRIRVRDGQPVGGLQEIEVERGEVVRLTVSSDSAQHIHLHGYDVIRDAGPGAPARFRFEADIEGIFEIELEGPHVQIAELRVEP
jgi:hypothetical protein